MTNDLSWTRPHVVLLGAGASRAAFPSGDSCGRQLPLMNDLVATCGLANLLSNEGIMHGYDDFEALYSNLISTPGHETLVAEIEKRLREYFLELTMPESPTIYDLLVLSLRKKDVIATFNWDPFLMCALSRTAHIHQREVPTVVFLHGNVALWLCPECEKPTRVGMPNSSCSNCGEMMVPSNLLYPVSKKDYSADSSIISSWNVIRAALKYAYVFTIFGYGAPVSDVDAVNLLKAAWGYKYKRELEQVEMIDIRPEESLVETWKDFIVEHHYYYANDISLSWLLRNPRRGCEAFWSQSMELICPLERSLRPGMNWNEVGAIITPLVKAELNHANKPA